MAANPKLRQPGPGWATFRGWSVLFDTGPPPDGDSLAALQLDDATITSNAIYEPLRRWSETLATELGDGFAVLPASTYHVTVCDGTNEAHAQAANGPAAHRLRRLVDSLPGALVDWRTALADVAGELEALLDAARQRVTMTMRDVELRGTALVAALGTDEVSRAAVSAIEAARAALLRRLAADYGLDIDTGRWAPHVTLGYWAEPARVRLDRPRIDELANPLVAALRDTPMSFAGASIYGFDDMATYWRAP